MTRTIKELKQPSITNGNRTFLSLQAEDKPALESKHKVVISKLLKLHLKAKHREPDYLVFTNAASSKRSCPLKGSLDEVQVRLPSKTFNRFL